MISRPKLIVGNESWSSTVVYSFGYHEYSQESNNGYFCPVFLTFVRYFGLFSRLWNWAFFAVFFLSSILSEKLFLNIINRIIPWVPTRIKSINWKAIYDKKTYLTVSFGVFYQKTKSQRFNKIELQKSCLYVIILGHCELTDLHATSWQALAHWLRVFSVHFDFNLLEYKPFYPKIKVRRSVKSVILSAGRRLWTLLHWL